MYLSSHTACGWLLNIYFSAALWQLLSKREKTNHLLTWLHCGIMPPYSSFPGASCQEPVSGANRAHDGCVSVHWSLQTGLLLWQICKTKGLSFWFYFFFFLSAKLITCWLGCRKEGITGELGVQQWHHCQGWDSGDWAMWKYFNPARLLSFILPLVMLQTHQLSDEFSRISFDPTVLPAWAASLQRLVLLENKDLIYEPFF